MVRTTTNASVQYTPAQPPENAAEMRRFVFEENLKIAAAINALALGHLDVAYVAPAKPRTGNVRIADGTSWNPGSGYGLYVYNGTAWVLVKAL